MNEEIRAVAEEWGESDSRAVARHEGQGLRNDPETSQGHQPSSAALP